jgi:hypothetical protein
VPHALFRHEYPAVHHYMVQSEDQFLVKVERLPNWNYYGNPLKWLKWKIITPRGELPRWTSRSKQEWYGVYNRQGEEGLRAYYRSIYTLSEERVREAIANGALTRDAGFAELTRQRYLPAAALQPAR